jgi:isopenicillin N synthase-like dioxygenase
MPATIPTSEVPVVDFSLFNHGSTEERIQTGKDIVKAFKEVGFVYLVNHQIGEEEIDEAFKQVSGSLFPRRDMLIAYRVHEYSVYHKTN